VGDEYRTGSEQQTTDARAVLAELRKRYPGLPIYVLTTSRSTISGAHHTCQATPYSFAAGLGERYPLVTVSGGKPPESGPCDPFSAHGFFGKEAETVDEPFPKTIE
jgi:hypothetical protein